MFVKFFLRKLILDTELRKTKEMGDFQVGVCGRRKGRFDLTVRENLQAARKECKFPV